MAESDVTIGELSRRLGSMDDRIGRQFTEVNRRLDGLQFVSQETYRVQMMAMERRLEELEEREKWRNRTLVAVAVLPFLVGILIALLGGSS